MAIIQTSKITDTSAAEGKHAVHKEKQETKTYVHRHKIHVNKYEKQFLGFHISVIFSEH